jgi:prepilin-type N-terminal cleavage/methylation domain-containing protein
MKHSKGFTLIEVFCVLIIVAIIAFVGVSAYSTGSSGGLSNVSFGINGMLETRCMGGYMFTIDQAGHTRQILDEFGKAAKCQ